MNDNTSGEINESAISESGNAKKDGVLAPDWSLKLLGWGLFFRRHKILTILFVAAVVTLIIAAMGRATVYVADAHTQIVRLENIDGLRTSVPLDGAVLCFVRGQRPTWSASVDAPGCPGLDAGRPPNVQSRLEIRDGSRAVVSRVGQGPLRVNLSSLDGDQAGRVISEGTSHDLPSIVFILLDSDDQATSRIVIFRAAAELGAPLEAQRLIFGGTIEIQRSGLLTRDRFVARREDLRTGDAIHFVQSDGSRAIVDGIVAIAPGEEGGLRATIQAKGSQGSSLIFWRPADEQNGSEVVYGAEISRTGSAPYTLRAGIYDNLLADPLFTYLSGFLGLLAIVATILAVTDQSSKNHMT